PHHLTLIESHSCKKQGRGWGRMLTQVPTQTIRLLSTTSQHRPRSNGRNSNPLYPLLHDYWIPPGVGVRSSPSPPVARHFPVAQTSVCVLAWRKSGGGRFREALTSLAWPLSPAQISPTAQFLRLLSPRSSGWALYLSMCRPRRWASEFRAAQPSPLFRRRNARANHSGKYNFRRCALHQFADAASFLPEDA